MTWGFVRPVHRRSFRFVQIRARFARESEEKLAPLGVRSGMTLLALIEVRPGVRSGKPCFIGTRIAVYDVLEYLAGGMTTAEIVDDFPELTEDHVRAALEFAAMRERRLAIPV